MNNEILKFNASNNNSFQNNDKTENKPKIRKSEIKSITIMNSKMDLWYFKNDILKDMKKFEKDITDKYNKGDIEVKEELLSINKSINSINSKISELSTLITVDNMTKEKVENLDKIKKKMLDDILKNEIKVINIDKETKEAIIKMNNILKDTVIYNGVIGPSCKYKSFHDLIDYILSELIVLDNYKDKNAIDLSTYKKKLDGIMQGIKFQIDGINKSSKEFATDALNICDKKIKDLNNNFNDKIAKIKVELEFNFNNINNKFDDLENKLKELKNESIINAKKLNDHIDEYLILKKELKNLNDIIKKNIFPSKKRISLYKRIDSKESHENNLKTIIKRMSNSIKNEDIEEIKSNKLSNINEILAKQNIFKDDEINKNLLTNQIPKKNINKDINDEKNKIHNISNDKLNSNVNLKIKGDNSNLSDKSLKFDTNSIQNMENIDKKPSKEYIEFSKKNKENINHNNKALSDIEKEKEKIKSPDIKSIIFLKKEKNLDITSSHNSSHSHKPIKNYNNKISQREIKKQIIKTKNDKNIFNQKLKKQNEENNKYISDLSKYKTVSKGNNTISDKLFIYKNKFSSSRFKNIILTLEGSKKMIIDSKNPENGKNIYHIESLKNDKKYPKLNINERHSSSKTNIIMKNIFKSQNEKIYTPNEEFSSPGNFKNPKIIYLIKSKSHRSLIKNKFNNLFIENKNINNKELEPSFSFTHYSPINNKKIINFDEKFYQKDKTKKIITRKK